MGGEADGYGGSSIGDLAGVGKIGTQIIQAVERATGAVYRPRAIRKEADAKAYEIVALAEAQSKADAITRLRADDTDYEIKQRAARRVVATAIQEQTNIENIVEASLALTHCSTGEAEKSLDDGWFARFLDGARSVTHSELQQVWSAILARQAGEGKFSLRLLDCLRNLEPEDLRAFEKFVWVKRAWNPLLTWQNPLGTTRYHNCSLISSEEEERLRDAGLIEHRVYLGAQSARPHPVTVTIKLMGRLYTVNAAGDTIILHNLEYTRVGQELEAIVDTTPATMAATLSEKAEDYLEKMVRSAKNENLTLELSEKQD